jgi:hypothetical protein
LYPFLISDAAALDAIQHSVKGDTKDLAAIIRASLSVEVDSWIAAQRGEAEESGFSPEEWIGEWPGEIPEKGSISVHKDLFSGVITEELYLGLATIEQPWHLPAVIRYGGWNECPHAEVQCAFYRHWQGNFRAEIASVSRDVIECRVGNPPGDRATAARLAWEH